MIGHLGHRDPELVRDAPIARDAPRPWLARDHAGRRTRNRTSRAVPAVSRRSASTDTVSNRLRTHSRSNQASAPPGRLSRGEGQLALGGGRVQGTHHRTATALEPPLGAARVGDEPVEAKPKVGPKASPGGVVVAKNSRSIARAKNSWVEVFRVRRAGRPSGAGGGCRPGASRPPREYRTPRGGDRRRPAARRRRSTAGCRESRRGSGRRPPCYAIGAMVEVEWGTPEGTARRGRTQRHPGRREGLGRGLGR